MHLDPGRIDWYNHLEEWGYFVQVEDRGNMGVVGDWWIPVVPDSISVRNWVTDFDCPDADKVGYGAKGVLPDWTVRLFVVEIACSETIQAERSWADILSCLHSHCFR